ncbi:MAG: S-layer homology domain-containing protein [Oscillospiraceae bacterium]|nr:S-layer homology domain-containing protein [Oscillospiraceae bacterium]
MKKLLALLLALTLLTGMASAAFTDESKITADYTDAVAYMSEKGVIGGFPDGSFKPKDTLTRAQAAKIICTVLEGADKVDAITATANFADVPAEHWASKFVGYCADKGIVSGVGGGKFNPNGQLTNAAFAKMLLVAFGADGAKFTGSEWVISVQKALREQNMNYKVGASDEPMQREQACQMAYNFMRTEELKNVTGYQEVTVVPTAQNVKLLGRAEASSDGVTLNFPCDGVEFTTDCTGEIKVQYSTKASHYLTAFVDGKETGARVTVPVGSGTVSIYRFIEPGEHTVRNVQDSEVNTSGSRATIKAVVLQAKSKDVKPTAKKSLYIEYVGASTVAGCGTLGDPKTAWSTATHSGTHSWAYLASETLNADYSIVAKGGIGFIKESGKVVYKPMYFCQNAWVDKDAKASFSRIPDIMVYASGGNDKKPDDLDQAYYLAAKEFLTEARKTLGSKTKIILTHGQMSDAKHLEADLRAINELGGEANGFYVFQMPRGNGGVIATGASTPHPSAADNVRAAAAFSEYVQQLLK